MVVTDPHYNALVAHEIVGHPSELDRGLKMEMAYAGRSWLLGDLGDTQVGRPIASPLVSAYSDPALPGYGHYAYDHDGTPPAGSSTSTGASSAGFLNSRQTAAIFGGEPNGHYKAADASLVPLIRMSNTVFDAGTATPPRSSATSSAATTWSPTGSPRSPRAGRTSGSRRAGSTRSGTASWDGSTGTEGSRPTRATT